MTPKEKAEELLTKYTIATWIKLDEIKFLTTIPTARECALIAVEEILNSRPVITDSQFEYNKYWEEVKKEIENYEQ